MAGILTRFRIEKLHGLHNIDLPIEANKIVLVGENGTGKSTVANFIYSFLTHQWSRLLEYDFHSITAIIDSKEITFSVKDLTEFSESRHFRSRLSANQINRLQYMLRREIIEEGEITPRRIEFLSRRYGLPIHTLYDYFRTSAGGLVQTELPFFETSKRIAEVEDTLKKVVKYQVLYLPTYRRIERDLRSIFRGFEGQFKEIQERQKRLVEHEGYIEFVEFGMQDVEEAIKQKMSDIKDNVRNGLNKLTGTYLRDVILGAYKSADLLTSISGLNEATINAIFARIPTEILPDKEQRKLRKIIRDITRRGAIEEKDEVVAHFLSQLIGLHKEQQKQESSVWDFVNVCNEYLQPNKEIIYDNVSFDIYVHKLGKDKDGQKISLRDLSSGEKQIVSLFSHVYLSGGTGYFFIIDEPELSLSVPWQKRFLPDILRTGLCKGLVAATHSPFIYDNEMEEYARSLEEFMETIVEVPRRAKKS